MSILHVIVDWHGNADVLQGCLARPYVTVSPLTENDIQNFLIYPQKFYMQTTHFLLFHNVNAGVNLLIFTVGRSLCDSDMSKAKSVFPLADPSPAQGLPSSQSIPLPAEAPFNLRIRCC